MQGDIKAMRLVHQAIEYKEANSKSFSNSIAIRSPRRKSFQTQNCLESKQLKKYKKGEPHVGRHTPLYSYLNHTTTSLSLSLLVLKEAKILIILGGKKNKMEE
eukprot:TRINITY_DN19450_c0_g1_i1.p1 TRINITY_DN19450_c0_g1~~TRINITY_DN19450_c0_g1_i1.p1  ORF type:complete len:103 (+),score=18.21 TRINITY_DN19450_c0_g1_i1:291-599(+)